MRGTESIIGIRLALTVMQFCFTGKQLLSPRKMIGFKDQTPIF